MRKIFISHAPIVEGSTLEKLRVECAVYDPSAKDECMNLGFKEVDIVPEPMCEPHETAELFYNAVENKIFYSVRVIEDKSLKYQMELIQAALDELLLGGL